MLLFKNSELDVTGHPLWLNKTPNSEFSEKINEKKTERNVSVAKNLNKNGIVLWGK